MRIRHNLWKVSNGWIMVPEGCDGMLSANEAPNCVVFRSLKEFSEWTPKRVRRKPKTKTTAEPPPQHTKD